MANCYAKSSDDTKWINNLIKIMKYAINDEEIVNFMQNMLASDWDRLMYTLTNKSKYAELMSILSDMYPKIGFAEACEFNLYRKIVGDKKWDPISGINGIPKTSAKDMLEAMKKFSKISENYRPSVNGLIKSLEEKISSLPQDVEMSEPTDEVLRGRVATQPTKRKAEEISSEDETSEQDSTSETKRKKKCVM
jgi:hypothetical protein